MIVPFYDFWVVGTPVGAHNAANILDDGTASYDAKTSTLTLNNFQKIIKEDIGSLVYFDMDGTHNPTINLVGENKAILSYNYGIYSLSDFTITGEGSLKLEASRNYALYSEGGDVTIKNTTIDLQGSNSAIFLENSGELTIINSSVKTTIQAGYESTDVAIKGISKLNLRGCDIVSPAGADFDAGLKGVAKDGVLVTEVTIAPKEYNFFVKDTKVTTLNASNILGDGTVSFDTETNVLTLNNANLESATVNPIKYQETAPLTINLVGKNNINFTKPGGYEPSLYIFCDLTITGDGSLKIDAGPNYGIFMNNGNLTIENTTLDITAGADAITSDNPESVMNITNSTVKAVSSDGVSILGFKNVTLTDCEITSPKGAAFVAESKGIVADGKLVDNLVIMPIRPYVNLGLTSGLMWATTNIGAAAPEAYGDYFAFAEIESKNLFTEENYLYLAEETFPTEDFGGNATYDAATANWGGIWRLPTKAECQELIDECTWSVITLGNDSIGFKVESKKWE